MLAILAMTRMSSYPSLDATGTKLRKAGAESDLLIFEGVSHADYALEATSPEHHLTYAELNRFLLQHLTAQ